MTATIYQTAIEIDSLENTNNERHRQQRPLTNLKIASSLEDFDEDRMNDKYAEAETSVKDIDLNNV